MTTVLDVQRFKDEHRRFAMLTAYDFLSARILDEAGIPILLVGDSLGMVMLGYPTTLPVTLDDMLHHAKAVARGARQAMLVGDMPFMSYQASAEQAHTGWADVIDFYARHNCDEYSFFRGYRRWTAAGALPARATAGVDHPATSK